MRDPSPTAHRVIRPAMAPFPLFLTIASRPFVVVGDRRVVEIEKPALDPRPARDGQPESAPRTQAGRLFGESSEGVGKCLPIEVSGAMATSRLRSRPERVRPSSPAAAVASYEGYVAVARQQSARLWRRQGKGDEARDLLLGSNLGTGVEVVSGLEPSDRVINSPPDSLAAGDIVHIAGPSGGSRERGGRVETTIDAALLRPRQPKSTTASSLILMACGILARPGPERKVAIAAIRWRMQSSLLDGCRGGPDRQGAT